MLKLSKKFQNFIIIVSIFIFCFLIRIETLKNTILDNHQFRQNDTYAMVINFLNGNSKSIFFPQIFETPDPINTRSYFLAEFPFYEYSIFLLFKIFGESVVLARLFTILLTAISTVAVFFTTKKILGRNEAMIAAIIFNLFPANFFWGRSISADVMAITFFGTALTSLVNSKKKLGLLISSLLFAGAVLIKPFYLAFMIAISIYLFIKNNKNLNKSVTNTTLYLIFPIVLLLLWQLWISAFPTEAAPVNSMSKFMHNQMGFLNFWTESNWPVILFKDYLLGQLLTPFGGFSMIIGLVLLVGKKNDNKYFISALVISSLIISLVISWGSKTHDYYLLHWMIPAAITAAFFINFLLGKILELIKKRSLLDGFYGIVLIALLGFFFYFLGAKPFNKTVSAYLETQGYDLYSAEFQEDYKQLKNLIPKDAIVINFLEVFDPYALNAIRRKGNIFYTSPFEKCPSTEVIAESLNNIHKLGSTHILFLHQDSDYLNPSNIACKRAYFQKILDKRFPLLFKGKKFSLYELKPAKVLITGGKDAISITTFNMGDDAVLEVSSEGVEGSTTFVPNWIQVSEFEYQTILFDTEGWWGIKINWQSPEFIIQNPSWQLSQDNRVLRK